MHFIPGVDEVTPMKLLITAIIMVISVAKVAVGANIGDPFAGESEGYATQPEYYSKKLEYYSEKSERHSEKLEYYSKKSE